jgi:hypothetical protein
MGGRAIVAWWLAVALVAAEPAAAQTTAGSVQGTVRDAQGAVLPGVSVVVRNTATAATWEQTTDAAGRYHVLLLPPGDYELHFSLPGFRPLARTGVRLTVGQR